jgi:hypothetical protein
MAQTNTRISPMALKRLRTLPRLVQAKFGVPATQEDIVSALVHCATLGQIAGMLLEYNMYTASPEAEDEAPSDPA